MLWAPINPGRNIPWTKIPDFGWVYKSLAANYLSLTKNEAILERIQEIAANPKGSFPVRGACRRFPLSTYIKKKMRGRIDGFVADELHEYNNNSGQGDAMAEIFGASKQFVGMTATQWVQFRHFPSAVPAGARPDAQGRQELPQPQKL